MSTSISVLSRITSVFSLSNSVLVDGCLNKHARSFMSTTVTVVGITIVALSNKRGRVPLIPWHHITLWRVSWVYEVEKNNHLFQSHMDRLFSAFKEMVQYSFCHRNKLTVTNQAQAYSLLLYLHAQSIKFSIGQVDIRTSTYEHLHLLW